MATVLSIKRAEVDLHSEWVKKHLTAAREAIADSVMFECPMNRNDQFTLEDTIMKAIDSQLTDDQMITWGANLKADIPDFQRFVDEWEPDSFEADNVGDL